MSFVRHLCAIHDGLQQSAIMDFLDNAQLVEEGERELALAAARTGRPGPRPRGSCLFCEEGPLLATQRWCDGACRDLWQRQQDVAAKWPRVSDD